MAMGRQVHSWHEKSGPPPSHEPYEPTTYRHLNVVNNYFEQINDDDDDDDAIISCNVIQQHHVLWICPLIGKPPTGSITPTPTCQKRDHITYVNWTLPQENLDNKNHLHQWTRICDMVVL